MSLKFSIIIPVYNVAPYLRQCLDSVLNQTFTDWEAVCVDDGSTDESGIILDEYATKDKRFIVRHQTNSGVSAARNRGLDIAAGGFILFLDGDDLLRPDYLEKATGVIANAKHIEMLMFRHKDFIDGQNPSWPKWIVDINDVSLKKTFHADYINRSFVDCIYKKSLVSGCRFKPYCRGEDLLFKSEVLMKCHNVLVSDNVIYGYRQREGSAMHQGHSLRIMRDEIAYRCEMIHNAAINGWTFDESITESFWRNFFIWAPYTSIELSHADAKEFRKYWADCIKKAVKQIKWRTAKQHIYAFLASNGFVGVIFTFTRYRLALICCLSKLLK